MFVYQKVLLLHRDWHTNAVENPNGLHARFLCKTLILYYLKLRHHEQEEDYPCSGAACKTP